MASFGNWFEKVSKSIAMPFVYDTYDALRDHDKDWYGKLDRAIDIGGTVDTGTREFGKQLPEEVRNVAPAAGGLIGGIWQGPGGGAAGAGIGSKIKGDDYQEGFKDAGIAALASYIGGRLKGGGGEIDPGVFEGNAGVTPGSGNFTVSEGGKTVGEYIAPASMDYTKYQNMMPSGQENQQQQPKPQETPLQFYARTQNRWRQEEAEAQKMLEELENKKMQMFYSPKLRAAVEKYRRENRKGVA
jgi:hypothetical protein